MSDDLSNFSAEGAWCPGQRWATPETNGTGTGHVCSWCCCGPLNRILVIAFMTVLACAVIVGNAITVTVFLGTRQFRTPQGYLKVSLALADLMVGVLVVPFSVYTEIVWMASGGAPPAWARGYSARAGGAFWHPCHLVGLVFAGCTFVSISTIFLLTVERSVAILKPLHKETVVTRSRTLATICCSWLAAFLLATAPLMFSDHFTLRYNECSRMCNYAFVPQAPKHSSWSILLLFPAFDFTLLGCTLVVNALSFSTIRRCCKQRKCLVETDNFRGPLRPSFSDIKAAKTIAILTFAFTASFSPIAAFVVGNVSGHSWCTFSFFAFWILAANSCCNFVIYSVRDQRFRKGVQQLFHKTLRTLPDKNPNGQNFRLPAGLQPFTE
ncbi:adenosine receptor A2b [Mobula hypostoma]|uniref:adenosine receptor A2b n=1 Tax=Mobula hypostoma TaxID=723540 RepID=UPI002FC3D269